MCVDILAEKLSEIVLNCPLISVLKSSSPCYSNSTRLTTLFECQSVMQNLESKRNLALRGHPVKLSCKDLHQVKKMSINSNLLKTTFYPLLHFQKKITKLYRYRTLIFDARGSLWKIEKSITFTIVCQMSFGEED